MDRRDARALDTAVVPLALPRPALDAPVGRGRSGEHVAADPHPPGVALAALAAGCRALAASDIPSGASARALERDAANLLAALPQLPVGPQDDPLLDCSFDLSSPGPLLRTELTALANALGAASGATPGAAATVAKAIRVLRAYVAAAELVRAVRAVDVAGGSR